MDDTLYSRWKDRIESELRPPASWKDLGVDMGGGIHVPPIHVSVPEGIDMRGVRRAAMRYEPVVTSAAELHELRQLDDDLSGPAQIVSSDPVESLGGAEDLAGIIVRPGPDADPKALGEILTVVRDRRSVARTGLLVDPLSVFCLASDSRHRGLPDTRSMRSGLLKLADSVSGTDLPFGSVDGLAVRAAGGAPSTVAAWVLVSLAAWLDRMDPKDLSVDGRIEGLRILVPVGNQPFVDAAVLTCIRDLTKMLVAAYAVVNEGPSTPALPSINAVSSPGAMVPSAAPADDAGNLVRATLQAVAASSAGADILSLQPFDVHRTPSADSVRFSAGVHRLLRHESRLDVPSDPLGGSYAFESMVRAVSADARTLFLELSKFTSNADELRERIRARILADRTAAPTTVRVGLDRYIPEDEVDAP